MVMDIRQEMGQKTKEKNRTFQPSVVTHVKEIKLGSNHIQIRYGGKSEKFVLIYINFFW